MKLLSLTTIGLATATPYKEESYRVRRDNEKQMTKRYFQLEDISEKVFSFNGQKWDDKKYWDYGCHCLLLGDRPMSEMGVGTPKDDLDKVCKKYKMCQKCVRDKHGDKCIGEAVAYDYKWKKKAGVVEFNDPAGSCPRELAECDYQFALDMLKESDHYADKFSGFYGDFDHKVPENCPVHHPTTGGGGNGGGDGDGGNGDGNGEYPEDPDPTQFPHHFECCGGHNKPYLWINTDTNQCCATDNGLSGISRPIGEC